MIKRRKEIDNGSMGYHLFLYISGIKYAEIAVIVIGNVYY